jgi:5S rRNA maturation endonuclease (ribonuclease M5)
MARVTEKERLEHEVYKELEELASEMNYNIDAVMVEGPHDKKTLRLLGYKKPILLCSKLLHTELSDLVAKKFSNVVILTDFDKQGNSLNRRLTDLFE